MQIVLISTSARFFQRDADEFLRKVDFLHVKSTLTDEERDRMSKAVGPINLDVPVKACFVQFIDWPFVSPNTLING